MPGNSSGSGSRLTDTVHYGVEEDWDFAISMKKTKKERNSVEKFCVSLLYSTPLAKKKAAVRKHLILFLNFRASF